MNTINRIKENRVVGVIRGSSYEEALKICHACIEGGLTSIEVTFTTPDAEKVINDLSSIYGDKALIGAGTVLDLETTKLAISNGSKYIVSPGFDEESAKFCLESNIPYFPGCMTITEMMNAKKYGVEVIKLFPGSVFGPSFIKAVKGPLPDIEIMPTGGVNLENINEWFSAGVVAVGIGGALTAPAKTGDYKKITEVAKEYMKKAKEVK